MKFNRFQLTAAALGAAALVAACGGGGSYEAPAAAGGGVVITGTAATGLALASAPVSVKCATGTGTATTDASGTYTITVTDGALPCMVEVTATVNGNTVTLHSIAEAGTTADGKTTARTNVTPLTELIVASLLGQAPGAAFQSFTGTGVTAEKVQTAVAAIKQAIKDATGVDLGTIDPLKATLVAATTSAPNGGNDYDKALDALAAKISTQSLVLMAGQIANNPTGGAEALAQALSFAPGCPSAVSGRYRAVGLTGSVIVGTLDFKAMTVKFDGHESSAPIAQNPDQACDFSMGTATFDGTTENRFAIGTQGAGAFRGAVFLDSSETTTGYLFPVQANTPDFAAAATASPWLIAQSGIATDETPQRVNWLTQMTFAADGKVSFCDYDNATNWTGACTAEDSATAVATSNGVELREGGTAQARFWSFRSPAGATTLYGTTRVDATTTTAQMTSFIATRQTTLALPAVGSTSRSETFSSNPLSSPNGIATSAPTFSTFTTGSVDTAAGTFSRSGNNNGSSVTNEVWLVNKPQAGVRVAQANVRRIQIPILGAGLTLSAGPTTDVSTQQNPNASNFNHSISVAMPTTTPTGGTAPAPTAPVVN